MKTRAFIGTVEVEFKSADPKIQEMLRAVNQFPEFTVERAEMEWMLFTTLARSAARQADFLRNRGK